MPEAKDYFHAFDCMACALFRSRPIYAVIYAYLYLQAGCLGPPYKRGPGLGHERRHNSAHAGCSVHFINTQTDKIYMTYCDISLELLKVGIF